jgi:hypothetical protein
VYSFERDQSPNQIEKKKNQKKKKKRKKKKEIFS